MPLTLNMSRSTFCSHLAISCSNSSRLAAQLLLSPMGCISSQPVKSAYRSRLHPHQAYKNQRRTLFGSSSSTKNRIYPSSIRRESDLQTLLLLTSSSRRPLITFWSLTHQPVSQQVSSSIIDLLSHEEIGETEGGVSYVEVDLDAPELGGLAGIPRQYGIDSGPVLLSFDRGEPQTETMVRDVKKLKDREFLIEWIRTEASRRGEGGAGGTWRKFLGGS